MKESEKLQIYIDKQREKGLVDFKVTLDYNNLKGSDFESVCKEINEMNQAVEEGRCTTLDFGDSKWKD